MTIRWSTRARSRTTKSAIGVDLVGHARGEHHLDAERLEPLGEPRRIRVQRVARDDLVADREQRGAHPAAVCPSLASAAGGGAATGAASRVPDAGRAPLCSAAAGHISPAGRAAAKPVRIRRCPATVMPAPLPAGDEPGRLHPADELSPRRKGGSRGAAAEPPPSASRGGFLCSHSRFAGTLALAALVARVPARRPPGRRRRPTPDRLALADRDRGSLRDRRGQAGRRGRQPVRLPDERPAHEALGLSRRTPRRSRRYNPDLVVVSYDADHIVEALGKLKIPVLVEPTASTLAQAYAQIGQLGDSDRPRGQGGGARRDAEAADRGDRRLGPAPPPGDHRLPRARARPLLGDLEDVHRPHLHAARAEGHRRRRRQGRLRLPAALGGVHRRRRSAPDRPRRHGLLRADAPRRSPRAPGWGTIAAVKDGGVLAVNDDIASRWGPRIVDFVRQVAAEVKAIAGK